MKLYKTILITSGLEIDPENLLLIARATDHEYSLATKEGIAIPLNQEDVDLITKEMTLRALNKLIILPNNDEVRLKMAIMLLDQTKYASLSAEDNAWLEQAKRSLEIVLKDKEVKLDAQF